MPIRHLHPRIATRWLLCAVFGATGLVAALAAEAQVVGTESADSPAADREDLVQVLDTAISGPLTSCHESDPEFASLFREASGLLNSGSNFEEALALFQLADVACSSVTALDGQARTWVRLGEWAQAQAIYRRMALAPSAYWAEAAANRVEAIERWFDKEEYAHVELRYSPVHAELAIDGRPAHYRDGQLLWRVAPGRHDITLRAAGYEPTRSTIRVGRSQTHAETLQLRARGTMDKSVRDGGAAGALPSVKPLPLMAAPHADHREEPAPDAGPAPAANGAPANGAPALPLEPTGIPAP